MTDKDTFINSLSVDELRYILGKFWSWIDFEECPKHQCDDFPCEAEDADLCSQCYEADGCWAQYYLWQYKNKKGEEK